jgi:two-component system, sensor histidine kinase LadS
MTHCECSANGSLVNSALRCLILCAALLIALIGNVRAGDVVTLVDGTEGYALGLHVDYLEDKTGSLTLDDVTGKAAQSFVASRKETPNFGFTGSAYWFRLELSNRHSSAQAWLLESQYPLLNRLDVHLVYPDNRIVSSTGGSSFPFAQRAIKHRNVMFQVPLAKGESVRVYIRVKTDTSMQMPLKLWSPRGLLVKDHEEQYVLGIFYGILIAMLCYNAMIFLSIRDKSYFYYLVYLSGWILLQMTLNGLAVEYLWPNSPWWATLASPFFVGLSLFGVIQFTRAFLQLKQNMPKLDSLFTMFMWFWILLMALPFVIEYPIVIKVATAGALATSIVIFIAGGFSLKRNIRQARYFMLAWSLLICSAIVYSLKTFGVLPSVFLTDYGMQIGSSFEVVLLSFALAHRMRILKEENERIQLEATETLELRVQQRTLELGQALQSFSEASEKLQAMSRIDGLTGVKNRTYFNERIGVEWRRALRGSSELGLLMLDIDNFKEINDTFGHLGGDVCLKQVAAAIRYAVRRCSDEVFRYGGEEFAVLLPETDIHGTSHFGELIRSAVEASEITLNDERIFLTISVGAACVTPRSDIDSEFLIGAADNALYQAKRNGRNQVRSHAAPQLNLETAVG